MKIKSDFDIIFELVGCNRLAKELLDNGMSVEKVKEIYGGELWNSMKVIL